MSELSPYLPGFLLAYSVLIFGMLSPGPNILAIIGTSMSVSRAAGLSLAFGTAVGSALWAISSKLGLIIVVGEYPWALQVVRIIGGLFLLWLAFKSFKSAASKDDIQLQALEADLPLWRYSLRGLAVQMTNPKAAVFWLAITSMATKEHAPLWVNCLFVFGVFIISLIGHQIYALAFSTNLMVRAYGKARRAIQFSLGALFTGAGIKLLVSRV